MTPLQIFIEWFRQLIHTRNLPVLLTANTLEEIQSVGWLTDSITFKFTNLSSFALYLSLSAMVAFLAEVELAVYLHLLPG